MQPSDDKMAVSRIYEAAWRAGYRGMIPEDFLASLPEGHWCSALESPDVLYLLCLEQNEFPIGVCSLAREKEEIISLYVLPERWGKGIGTLLLEAAWDIFLARGCSGAFFWVLAENRRARLSPGSFTRLADFRRMAEACGRRLAASGSDFFATAARKAPGSNPLFFYAKSASGPGCQGRIFF